MIAVHLHGPLAEFGGPHPFDVRDTAEAIRALGSQLPGFREAIVAGNWQVIAGPLEEGRELGEDDLTKGLGAAGELHILPALEGAGNGVGQIIAGVIIAIVGWWNPFGWKAAGTLIGAGIGMAMGGIVQMTTKIPSAPDYAGREAGKKASFLFDGPTNTSTQGMPVPVIYGRIRVGSVVISAGITSEETT